MDTDTEQEDNSLALDNATSEMFKEWKSQARINEEFASEWEDYSTLMTAYHEALERAPRTTKACADVNIVELLISELEHLADVVNAILPGGIMELASYTGGSKRRLS